ncbi:hypothetical protein MRB53_042027 [Persea americana]|nr:hypothetical protein MRB53_042027 [Persea americana]
MLQRIAGMSDHDRTEKPEIEVNEGDGTLSVPKAKRMFKWLAEAVGRGLELSGGGETAKDVAVLQRLLITHIGDIYINSALDAAADAAIVQEQSRNEPDLAFVPEVRSAITILQLTIGINRTVLLPLAASNVSISREMEKSLTGMITKAEERIGSALSRTIDVALNWVSKLMARQVRTDFRPRDDDLSSIEQLQTPTCSQIFTFMVKVRETCSSGIEGKNLESFFTELAMGFCALVLDHFKKFQVSPTGGLMVSKDITKYSQLLRTFPLLPEFLSSLEVLAEIGNIFVISPEALKDRLRGMDKADLRAYVLRREDANSVAVQTVLNSI